MAQLQIRSFSCQNESQKEREREREKKMVSRSLNWASHIENQQKRLGPGGVPPAGGWHSLFAMFDQRDFDPTTSAPCLPKGFLMHNKTTTTVTQATLMRFRERICQEETCMEYLINIDKL